MKTYDITVGEFTAHSGMSARYAARLYTKIARHGNPCMLCDSEGRIVTTDNGMDGKVDLNAVRDFLEAQNAS